MAFPAFDPLKHARGFHGRFAPGGGVAVQRFRSAGGVSRVRTTLENAMPQDTTPHPHRPESVARRRWLRITEAAWQATYHAPRGQRGAVMREATDRFRSPMRTPRAASKRSFTGKTTIVRAPGAPHIDEAGISRYYGKRLRLRNLAGRKR